MLAFMSKTKTNLIWKKDETKINCQIYIQAKITAKIVMPVIYGD